MGHPCYLQGCPIIPRRYAISIDDVIIWGILVESIRTYAPILFILAAAIAFSRVLTLMQVPQAISSWILLHFTNPVILLLVINAFC